MSQEKSEDIVKDNLDRLLALGNLAQQTHSIPTKPLTLILEGLSGFGKTARIRAWAKENGITLVEENASTYPSYAKALAEGMSKEDLYQELYHRLNQQKNTVYFLNEIQFLDSKTFAFFDPILRYLSIPEGKNGLRRIPGLLFIVGEKTL
jgi:Cdc6-like AAA superfamily ATPase